MANVAMIGAGKLGFPVGCVMSKAGHVVSFYDTDTATLDRYRDRQFPEEEGLKELYSKGLKVIFENFPAPALYGADYIFVAVQTPHKPEQDGSVRFHHVQADFDLSYVKQACKMILEHIAHLSQKHIVIISTMLPGSMDREIAPLFQGTSHNLLYSPSFIAMGTTVHDFSHPEFYLIGARTPADAEPLMDFYHTINRNAAMRVMSYASAEATKVFYNTQITMKITLANLIMEIAHHIPNCNATDITEALKCAKDRIVSTAYMSPGMVDGGGCHPRDNIALSWLSEKLRLRYNLFDYMMETREDQVEFLASLIRHHLQDREQVVILGKAFKPGTRIVAGSPSILLGEILKERGIAPIFYDRLLHPELPPQKPSVYFIGVRDPFYCHFSFAPGSVILDPWDLMSKAIPKIQLVNPDVQLITIGRNDAPGS